MEAIEGIMCGTPNEQVTFLRMLFSVTMWNLGGTGWEIGKLQLICLGKTWNFTLIYMYRNDNISSSRFLSLSDQIGSGMMYLWEVYESHNTWAYWIWFIWVKSIVRDKWLKLCRGQYWAIRPCPILLCISDIYIHHVRELWQVWWHYVDFLTLKYNNLNLQSAF